MIEEFLNLADVLPLDKSVKKTIEIRRKHRKMKLADAIIAATAIVNGRILLTNNTKDFVNIKGLKLIDSHRL